MDLLLCADDGAEGHDSGLLSNICSVVARGCYPNICSNVNPGLTVLVTVARLRDSSPGTRVL
jgi:hypothetical protein